MTQMPTQSRYLIYAAILLVSALTGIGAVYVTMMAPDNTSSPSAAKSPPLAAAKGPSAGTPLTYREPLARGDMAAFVFYREPHPLPEIGFLDEKGESLGLSRWKGKVILLNLWATWCAPCRKEMPDFDRLQAALGSDKFEVVALAIDRTGVAGAKAFLDKVGVKFLAPYTDESLRSTSRLRVVGMPTTLLIDPAGREVGRLTGPALWDGADARALISAQVERLHASP